MMAGDEVGVPPLRKGERLGLCPKTMGGVGPKGLRGLP